MSAVPWGFLSFERTSRSNHEDRGWHELLRDAEAKAAGPTRTMWRPVRVRAQTEASCSALSPEPQSLEFQWQPHAIELGPDRHDLDNLSAIFVEIDKALYDSQFRLLGRALATISVELLSPQVLVTILRATAVAKDRVPDWSETVRKVREELDRRGLDGKKILRGIL